MARVCGSLASAAARQKPESDCGFVVPMSHFETHWKLLSPLQNACSAVPNIIKAIVSMKAALRP
jgi:hypothetical protein